MKEDEEDGGISVEFDQCAQEISYYKSCLEDRGDGSGDVSRCDSAVCLNSARDPLPAVLQRFNSSRRNHCVRTFREENVKISQSYRKEMEKQRTGTDSYLLTQQRLVIHLIDFVDLPLKKNTKRRIWTDRVTSPLYTITESGLEVNSDYFFPMESPYASIQKSYLRSLADSLTRSHRKLIEICDFVERCEEHSQLMLPTLIAVLCDWVNGFLRDHTRQLDELRSERLDDPLHTLSRLNTIVEDVEIVRLIIGDDAGRNIWLWEDIEKSWNRVFLLTQHEALVKKRIVVKNLQRKWTRALLSTMDHIFETGRVPPGVVHFVLHK
uniref:Dynein heavy chain 7, axonemal n=1 Tax=Caenorhabditis tropicalis TaxID=1561998 RepID=A0A1I7UUB2_9PELO